MTLATGVLLAVATFLGGVYFPVQLLPSWLGQIAQWLPLTFALEALRQAVLQGAGSCISETVDAGHPAMQWSACR